MRDLLLKLAKAQKELEQQKKFYTSKKIEFDEQMKITSEVIANCNQEISDIKSAIEPLATAEFKRTGEKKLVGGIGIQEKNVLSYDEQKAFDFAYEKKMFLQLNKKEFEKVAESLSINFVSTEKRIKVTFPKEIILE